jgi:Leucine-rich repeat (LRR) protein
MVFNCVNFLNYFDISTEDKKNKELLPHIQIFYSEESEHFEMLEDGFFIKNSFIIEKEETFETVEKLLEFNKKESVVKISLRNMNISDISFLNEFPGVISLDLSFNNIKDLSTLSKLEKLKKLNLSYNTFTSLKGLEGCQNLEQLFMIFNPIENIDELKSLSSLKVLDIEETMVKSIELLDELKNLEYVYIPFVCKFGLVINKLKNIVTFSKLIGKGATSSKLYLNNIYVLSDGVHVGRKKFIL